MVAPNQCSADDTPPAPWGTTEWVDAEPGSSDAYFSVVAGDSQASRIVVSDRLNQISARTGENKIVWTKNVPVTPYALNFSFDDLEVFVGGGPSNGGAGFNVYDYGQDGSGGSLVASEPELGCVIDGQGFSSHVSLAVIHCSDYVKLRVSPYSWGFTAPDGLDLFKAIFDPAGNVLVLAETSRPTVVNGMDFGAAGKNGFLILKFTAAGKLLWAHELVPQGTYGDAIPNDIGVSSSGAVVVTGAFQGDVTWANKQFSAPTYTGTTFALDGSGNSRWLAMSDLVNPRVAVDASGRAFAVSNSASCQGGLKVVEYDVSTGSPLGERGLACGGGISLSGLATFGHDLLLIGVYTGANDFGNGFTTPSQSGGSYLTRLSGYISTPGT